MDHGRRKHPRRKVNVPAGVQSVPLVVVQKERVRRRREVGQTSGDSALTLGSLMRIRKMELSHSPQPGRLHCQLKSPDMGPVDREREENVRVPDRVVIKEVLRCGMEVAGVYGPASYRKSHSSLPLLVSLSVQRKKADALAQRQVDQRTRHSR